jgi:glutathione S-transferase
MQLTLISHHLCPYVQRAAIVLLEKQAPFTRRWVDLADKPDWFRALSPLGRTPVLQVEGAALFESAVICEYLDETVGTPLHPLDPLERARHRSWIEFGSAVLNTIAAFYNARDAASLQDRRADLRGRFAQVEAALDARGPYFAGPDFSLVDAVFGPVFRYFDVFERLGEDGFFTGTPRLREWRQALAARPSVQQAAVPDYAARLREFLEGRGSELSRRIALRRTPVVADQAPVSSSAPSACATTP